MAWNIRRIRVLRGIAQDDLALSAGVERAYVGHLERGSKNPTIETLQKIAGALDCKIAELFQEPPENAEKLKVLKSGRKKSHR
ncbi:helix-turn-helix domain-containing protein [Ectorhizobium quercum]|uniref:helix-turn-helix domain-containing protein n=1 Tax=Ectorhizobium quercum TaxID=2965071 RepID=UPI002796270A|nr:helix-turn-helix transcriptional regulator [Ectorhizobium quercum]